MNQHYKTIIIIALVTILGFFIVWLILAAVESTRTTITINTSPKYVDILIGEETYRNSESGSSFTLTGKEAEIVVKREGFSESKFTHVFSDNEEENTLNISLNPMTFEAEQLLMTDEESRHRESIVTDAYLQLIDKVSSKYPILAELPYHSRYFTMSQGVSIKNPDDPEAFALYVDVFDEFRQEGRTEALEFIRSSGYNPDDYEIIFREEKYQVRSD